MHTLEFVQIVAAVMAANVLTGVYVVFLWRASKVHDFADLPFQVLAAGIVPPIVMAFGAYLYF